MHLSNVKPISTFIGSEQPETCRICGAGTDFIILSMGRQLHECLNCGNVYYLEFEGDLFEDAI